MGDNIKIDLKDIGYEDVNWLKINSSGRLS
jgi:hypothetical protein